MILHTKFSASKLIVSLYDQYMAKVICTGHFDSEIGTSHAPYHVINKYVPGASRNQIFGIADPTLPIHYTTFMELWWWLRVVCKVNIPIVSIFFGVKSVLRMRRITWSVTRGSLKTTYLESPNPLFLFSLQLLFSYDDDWGLFVGEHASPL